MFGVTSYCLAETSTGYSDGDSRLSHSDRGCCRTGGIPLGSLTTFHKCNPKRELDNHPNCVAKKLRKNLKFLLTFNDYLFILIPT